MNQISKTLIAAMSLSLMGAAHAQDSATADAVASLSVAQAPLTVTVQDALSFGEILIPNGTQTGHSCQYNISVPTPNPTFALRELDATGASIDTSAPTASGCGRASDSVAIGDAEFAIACSPTTPVNFTASFADGAQAGVTFAAPYQSTAMHVRDPLTNAIRSLSSGTASTVSSTCTTNGFLRVAVGGSVTVDATATPGSSVTVGSIVLDASY